MSAQCVIGFETPTASSTDPSVIPVNALHVTLQPLNPLSADGAHAAPLPLVDVADVDVETESAVQGLEAHGTLERR